MNLNDNYLGLFARSPTFDRKSAMNFGGTRSIPATAFQYDFKALPAACERSRGTIPRNAWKVTPASTLSNFQCARGG